MQDEYAVAAGAAARRAGPSRPAGPGHPLDDRGAAGQLFRPRARHGVPGLRQADREGDRRGGAVTDPRTRVSSTSRACTCCTVSSRSATHQSAPRNLVLWSSLECSPPCQGGGRGFKSRQDRSREARPASRQGRGPSSMPRPRTPGSSDSGGRTPPVSPWSRGRQAARSDGTQERVGASPRLRTRPSAVGIAATQARDTGPAARASGGGASGYRHLTRHCPICHRLLRLAAGAGTAHRPARAASRHALARRRRRATHRARTKVPPTA